MVDDYLRAGWFVESDDPQLVAFARNTAAAETEPLAQAVLLHEAVRDGIVCDPYDRFAAPPPFGNMVSPSGG